MITKFVLQSWTVTYEDFKAFVLQAQQNSKQGKRHSNVTKSADYFRFHTQLSVTSDIKERRLN